MAERVVDGFERILRMAIGFRLAEADVGQFALDQIGKSVVLNDWFTPAIGDEAGNAGLLAFEVVQNILQAFLDPSEIARPVIARGLQPFEQVRYALLQMSQRGRAVIADRDPVETI